MSEPKVFVVDRKGKHLADVPEGGFLSLNGRPVPIRIAVLALELLGALEQLHDCLDAEHGGAAQIIAMDHANRMIHRAYFRGKRKA